MSMNVFEPLTVGQLVRRPCGLRVPDKYGVIIEIETRDPSPPRYAVAYLEREGLGTAVPSEPYYETKALLKACKIKDLPPEFRASFERYARLVAPTDGAFKRGDFVQNVNGISGSEHGIVLGPGSRHDAVELAWFQSDGGFRISHGVPVDWLASASGVVTFGPLWDCYIAIVRFMRDRDAIDESVLAEATDKIDLSAEEIRVLRRQGEAEWDRMSDDVAGMTLRQAFLMGYTWAAASR